MKMTGTYTVKQVYVPLSYIHAKRKGNGMGFLKKENDTNKDTNKDTKIEIGKITNAVGLKGEVKVYNYSDPDRYDRLKEVLVGDARHKITGARYQSGLVVLKLSGVNDRNAAEALKGQSLYVLESELPKLPEDTYYIRDLIGSKVVNDEDGSEIGTISDVIQNSAQDVYEIDLASGKKGYVPAVGTFVKDVNIAEKTVTIHVIEGLFD